LLIDFSGTVSAGSSIQIPSFIGPWRLYPDRTAVEVVATGSVHKSVGTQNTMPILEELLCMMKTTVEGVGVCPF